MAKKNRRYVQAMVLERWRESAMSRMDLARAVGTISPTHLNRYLAGRSDAYMRERTVEAVLTALEEGPQGPKREAMCKERA
jgi:hypothetical protein